MAVTKTDPTTSVPRTLRLNRAEWLCVAGLVLLVMCLTPRLWRRIEKTGFGENYRIPYESSKNYWMFTRWAEAAREAHAGVAIGDSAIWGHYVDRDSTLPAHLSAARESGSLANLGVDGLHPVAMYGLIRYHGRAIRDTAVMLHLNPLWMSSPVHDLQVDEEIRFNHPDLVPQLYPDIPAYQPTWATRVGVWHTRHVPFMKWISHMQQTYLEGLDLFNWSIQHPRQSPCSAMDLALPASANQPRSRPMSWSARGIPANQELQWVTADRSLQWAYFKKTIGLLQHRGNTVFVLIGPFNTYLLREDQVPRYRGLVEDMVRWFEAESDLPFHVAAVPPSADFADASHPLDRGYRFVADDLARSASYRKWSKTPR